MKKDSYDLLAKLLIIGDSGVGKTNILLRFCQGNFTASHLTTIGIDFKIKTLIIDDKKIRMQIWDTAGQQRFKTITQTYYKGAMGIIMTYSIDDTVSFHSLQNWLKQIKTHASQDVIKVLVANKIDNHNRSISYDQGKNLANNFGVEYFEVSAKQGIGINEVFEYLGKQIKNKLLNNDKPQENTYIKNKIKNQNYNNRNCC